MATKSGQAKASVNERPVSPWAAALNQLRECGMRRHIKNAFKASATVDEIMKF